MRVPVVLHRVVPLSLLALALSNAPSLAFDPSVTVDKTGPGEQFAATDLAGKGSGVAVTIDTVVGGEHYASMRWSHDLGASWDGEGFSAGTREPQIAICHSQSVMVYGQRVGTGPDWDIRSFGWDLDGPGGSGSAATTSGINRKPDNACVKDAEDVIAWFHKQGSGYHVRMHTHGVGEDLHQQSFDLGRGTMSRGLAIATSSSRVFVAWFQGDTLKVKRYSIGGAPRYDLKALGTTSVATLAYGDAPRIGAFGSRVILAYTDKGDLKVRRSTDGGSSFGSAKTLKDAPWPSEVAFRATTVAVKGSLVTIGAVRTSESAGTGIGFRSTNGGSSYAVQASHAGGRTVAGIVKGGSSDVYAEAWDESFTDPNPAVIQFRHQ